MPNLTHYVIGQIAKQVEPLTRHSRSSLGVRGGDTRVTTGMARAYFNVTLSNAQSGGAGHLPPVQHRVGSEEELRQRAADVEASAIRHLPERLQEFARSHGPSDRDLSERDCFDGPRTFGSEWPCPKCAGRCRVSCPEPGCENGYHKCGACHATGRIDCDRCKSFWRQMLDMDSKGRIPCPHCRSGRKPDGSSCGTCQRRGWILCPTCGGDKKVTHKPCGGSGHLRCSRCKGDGFLPCDRCNALGYFHSMRTVSCAVSRTFEVKLDDEANAEVKRRLTQSDLGTLRVWGAVQWRQVTAGSSSLVREYDVACAVTEVPVGVGAKALCFTGFGETATLYNYQNVVTELLQDDLAALRSCLNGSPLWTRAKHRQDLLTALSRFLASEVNIHTHHEPRKSAYVRDGIVSAAYVDQARGLIGRALWRLYASDLSWGAAVTGALTVAVFAGIRVTDLASQLGNWTLPTVAAGGGILLLIFERRSRTRLSSGLSIANETLGYLLSRHFLTWKVRAIVIVITALLLWAVSAATSQA